MGEANEDILDFLATPATQQQVIGNKQTNEDDVFGGLSTLIQDEADEPEPGDEEPEPWSAGHGAVAIVDDDESAKNKKQKKKLTPTTATATTRRRSNIALK